MNLTKDGKLTVKAIKEIWSIAGWALHCVDTGWTPGSQALKYKQELKKQEKGSRELSGCTPQGIQLSQESHYTNRQQTQKQKPTHAETPARRPVPGGRGADDRTVTNCYLKFPVFNKKILTQAMRQENIEHVQRNKAMSRKHPWGNPDVGFRRQTIYIS